MDNVTLIRVVAGICFVIVLVVLIQRRRKRVNEAFTKTVNLFQPFTGRMPPGQNWLPIGDSEFTHCG